MVTIVATKAVDDATATISVVSDTVTDASDDDDDQDPKKNTSQHTKRENLSHQNGLWLRRKKQQHHQEKQRAPKTTTRPASDDHGDSESNGGDIIFDGRVIRKKKNDGLFRLPTVSMSMSMSMSMPLSMASLLQKDRLPCFNDNTNDVTRYCSCDRPSKKFQRQYHHQHKNRSYLRASSPFLLLLFLLLLLLLVPVVWRQQQRLHFNFGMTSKRIIAPSPLLSPKAYPVYGTYVEYTFNTTTSGGNTGSTISTGNINNNKNDPNKISVVYALPPPPSSSSSSSTFTSSSSLPTHQTYPRGVVLLLHACTHSAFKFFSPSPLCPMCVGLAEELEIVRRVLERNYAVLAVTCLDVQKTGCWSDADVRRLRFAIGHFIETTMSIPLDSNNTGGGGVVARIPTVFAIGASSGGYMAARLLLPEEKQEGHYADVPIDAALIIVMGLSQSLQDKLKQVIGPSIQKTTSRSPPTLERPNRINQMTNVSPRSRGKKVYFAPMIKDRGTANRVRENVKALLHSDTDSGAILTASENVFLDETSCQPLPVTVDYLWHRVTGMTKQAAHVIVTNLVQDGHINSTSGLLVVDPTTSNWRDILLANDQPTPESLKQTSSSSSSTLWLSSPNTNYQVRNDPNQQQQSCLWGVFDLTPGRSPLAKALHRAWAVHEYCSEAVDRALDFFERESDE